MNVPRETFRYAAVPCGLGYALVAESRQGICAILLGDEEKSLVEELRRRFPTVELVAAGHPFEGWLRDAAGWIERADSVPEFPLDVRGTEFQKQVWDSLRQIPWGSTASYTDVARRIGRPSAVRAVASACGANPLAVVVPCHRVVRSDGDLSGYRWGTQRKRQLLRTERGSLVGSPVR